jgi:sugar phosphate isomerase/epimerase
MTDTTQKQTKQKQDKTNKNKQIKMIPKSLIVTILAVVTITVIARDGFAQNGVVPIVPDKDELMRPFSEADEAAFFMPPKVYYPETWFHFIGGNVAKAGITADLEAIAQAGFSGVQFFHGQTNDLWPHVTNPVTCLSPQWDEHLRFLADECRRLGLRFSMHNCPGWSQSGGPWITPDNAMRNLVYSRTDLKNKQIETKTNNTKQKPTTKTNKITLPLPNSAASPPWRDYKDIAVIAFPTPLDDATEPVTLLTVSANDTLPWRDFLQNDTPQALKLNISSPDKPHIIDVTFPKDVIIRTVEFFVANEFSFEDWWCYEPGIHFNISALQANGKTIELLDAEMPQTNWQDEQPISIALSEVQNADSYRISIINKHVATLKSIRFYTAARKNSWESEAAWTLRSMLRANNNPVQSRKAYIDASQIIDISSFMDSDGELKWNPPTKGDWTVLRVGHVNAGMRNAPAPPEGTGWECDKLNTNGADAHFAGYIGKIADGALAGGLLNGMHIDSWECKMQTWTGDMPQEFENRTGYPLLKRLPALFGYVIDSQEETARFLLDWRGTLNHLLVNEYYGRLAELSHTKGLSIAYETSAGDVYPADIMEYFKHADVPMCEFWQPVKESAVGSLNFKPIKPTVSAARMYGKPRVAAEAFTCASYWTTWDEHLSYLKEVANLKLIEGVTHLVFHTYTHNPQTDWLPPGTTFGGAIGTPFLRGQTWWKYMPEINTHFARLNYMLERGRPVSDILLYLGDEINHKPDQNIEYKGYKYDYCNTDVLLNRLTVNDGKIMTPEGLTYSVLLLYDCERMLPETLEKLLAMAKSGAVIIGDAPKGLATLKGGKDAARRFNAAVKELWGKGKVITGVTLEEALQTLEIQPDVVFGTCKTVSNINDNEDISPLWLHRRTDNADWYFIAAPYESGFSGELSFNNYGAAELWNPLTGEITSANSVVKDGRANITLALPRAGSCFVVFRNQKETTHNSENPKTTKNQKETIIKLQTWTLFFPSGWGAPDSLTITELKPWKDLYLSPEGKAFSGTVIYKTSFTSDKGKTILDLGEVEMIAVVTLNGTKLRTLWTPPYSLDITDALKEGENVLQIEVTNTWYNRLVYDSSQPDSLRKTWTIRPPSKAQPLKNSGLLGPVQLILF